MSARKTLDKTRPPTYQHNRGFPGAVTFSMDVSEGDERTVHLDAFGKMPYGHIRLADAIALRDWLNAAIPWLQYSTEEPKK